jgi:hypothetical protein
MTFLIGIMSYFSGRYGWTFLVLSILISRATSEDGCGQRSRTIGCRPCSCSG